MPVKPNVAVMGAHPVELAAEHDRAGDFGWWCGLDVTEQGFDPCFGASHPTNRRGLARVRINF